MEITFNTQHASLDVALDTYYGFTAISEDLKMKSKKIALVSIEVQQTNHRLMGISKVKCDFSSIIDYKEFRSEMFNIAIQPWVINTLSTR